MGLRQKLQKRQQNLRKKQQPKSPQAKQRKLAKSNNKSFGDSGEDFACKILQDRGYKILKRNYKTKFAEIDIIALDGSTIVFVEVKARKSTKFGGPYEAVDERKLFKIKMGANSFIKERGLEGKKFRIDVVSLILGDEKSVKVYKIY